MRSNKVLSNGDGVLKIAGPGVGFVVVALTAGRNFVQELTYIARYDDSALSRVVLPGARNLGRFRRVELDGCGDAAGYFVAVAETAAELDLLSEVARAPVQFRDPGYVDAATPTDPDAPARVAKEISCRVGYGADDLNNDPVVRCLDGGILRSNWFLRLHNSIDSTGPIEALIYYENAGGNDFAYRDMIIASLAPGGHYVTAYTQPFTSVEVRCRTLTAGKVALVGGMIRGWR